MTVSELICELRKPGKVFMPVVTASDVVHIAVEKSDLISILSDYDSEEAAPWRFYGEYCGGRKLDINT